MTVARRAEIFVRGNTRSDASARMLPQRRIKTRTCEATHFDGNGAPTESACMPGIVGEVDHLRCLTSVLAGDYLFSPGLCWGILIE